MSVVLVNRGLGLYSQLLHSGMNCSRPAIRWARRCAASSARDRLRHAEARRGRAGRSPKFFAAELRRRLARSRYGLRLRAARGVAAFTACSQERGDEMIVPVHTLRVLRAARDAGVKRVVLTSSSAAISYGCGCRRRVTTRHIGRMSVSWRRAPVCQIEDVGRARGLGLLREKAVPSNSLSSIRFWCSARVSAPTLYYFGEAADGGRRARLPPTLFRRCRCARIADLHIRAMADPAQGRTLPGGRGRFHVGPSNCASAEGGGGAGRRGCRRVKRLTGGACGCAV